MDGRPSRAEDQLNGETALALGFTGERIVPGAADCEPTFAQKMYQEHLARYAFAAQFAAGADVLDVGCGVGYGSQWLGKSGAKSVLGFDLSEAAVDHARMNYFHPAVSYKVADATAIEPGDGYDLVTCFELIEHIAPQEHVLDLIKGALREEGVLVISTPRPLDQIRTHFHVHEMNFEELYRMLGQRFKNVVPFFQINSFSSFVGAAMPDRLDHIIPVTDRINMDNADYFVFVASDAEIFDKTSIHPILSMNDDSYILNLEKDVGVLRRAENNHVARIADLERSEADLIAAVNRAGAIEQIREDTGLLRQAMEHLREQQERQAAAHAERDSLYVRVKELEQALEHAARAEEVTQLRALLDDSKRDFEARRAETDIQTKELLQLRSLLDDRERDTDARRAEIDAQAEEVMQLRALLDDRERDAEALGAEIDALRDAADSVERERDRSELALAEAEAELDNVRRVLAGTSAKLAEKETEVFSLRGDAGRLPEAMARVSALENELNALRYRFDVSEATLKRFRTSLSWSVTRPLRWIGRTFRKMTGRSLPQ